MLAIIIPTINRSDFLIRQLTYYADVGYRHSVYVADSSSEEHLIRTRDAIQELSSRIRIVHIQVPQSNDYQATADILPQIQEPYVCWLGDDDFFIPRALEECARFLDANPDYESAHGIGMQFSLHNDRERGDVGFLGYYPQGSAEQGNAPRRLIDFMGAYWPICFSVQRIETYRDAVDLAHRLPDKGVRELAMSSFPILRGKAKQLNILHVVRQHHQGRYFLPDVFDWVTGPDWQPSYQVLRDGLSSELARQEGSGLEEAQEVVKQALWTYLSRGMNHQWQSRYGSSSEGLRDSLRRTARSVPGMRRLWNRTKSHLPGAANQVSLSAMLRPSSPYHADFMPIYSAITPQAGESSAASSGSPVSTVSSSSVR